VVKFVGGALGLPGADINEFLEAMIETGGVMIQTGGG